MSELHTESHSKWRKDQIPQHRRERWVIVGNYRYRDVGLSVPPACHMSFVLGTRMLGFHYRELLTRFCSEQPHSAIPRTTFSLNLDRPESTLSKCIPASVSCQADKLCRIHSLRTSLGWSSSRLRFAKQCAQAQ